MLKVAVELSPKSVALRFSWSDLSSNSGSYHCEPLITVVLYDLLSLGANRLPEIDTHTVKYRYNV